jgi:hypothetical protein
VTAAAVAAGVALLLGVLAEFHAFQANRDPSSSDTIAAALPSPVSAAARRGSTPIWSVPRSRQSGRSPAFSAGLMPSA